MSHFADKTVYSSDESSECAVKCTFAGKTFPNPWYSISYSPASDYIFEYIISGKGYLESEGSRRELHPGMMCFIKKGVSALCYSDKNDPYEKIWFHMNGSMVKRVIDSIINSDILISETDVGGIFFEIHDMLMRDNIKSSNEMMRVWCGMFEIISSSLENTLFSEYVSNTPLYVKIRDFIDSNIYSDISLDRISEIFGITKMHVIRLFKQNYNTTPIKYVNEKRIEISKKLLTDTVMPIKEISHMLRYSNTQHFSSVFKTVNGCTPNAYRHNINNTKSDI